MGRTCCVRDCPTHWKDPEIRFHAIPKKKERRQQWIALLENAYGKHAVRITQRNSNLCSRHFLSTDYEPPDWEGKIYLRRDAVPSKFPKVDHSNSGQNLTPVTIQVTSRASSVPAGTDTQKTVRARIESDSGCVVISVPHVELFKGGGNMSVDGKSGATVLPAAEVELSSEHGESQTSDCVDVGDVEVSTNQDDPQIGDSAPVPPSEVSGPDVLTSTTIGENSTAVSVVEKKPMQKKSKRTLASALPKSRNRSYEKCDPISSAPIHATPSSSHEDSSSTGAVLTSSIIHAGKSPLVRKMAAQKRRNQQNATSATPAKQKRFDQKCVPGSSAQLLSTPFSSKTAGKRRGISFGLPSAGSTPTVKKTTAKKRPVEDLTPRRHDHGYSAETTPRKYRLIKLRAIRLAASRREVVKALALTKAKLKRREKRLEKLTEVVAELKKKVAASAGRVIDGTHKDAITELIQLRKVAEEKVGQRSKKAKTVQKFSEQVKQFAMLLHFYSPKAYNFFREDQKLPLPSTRQLRRWTQNVQMDPGFLSLSFAQLSQFVEKLEKSGQEKSQAGGTDTARCHCHEKKVIVSLVFDEMSLNSGVQFHNGRQFGFQDIGHGNPEDADQTNIEVATEALVFLAVGVNKRFRLPIYYGLTHSLEGEAKASLIQQAVIKLKEAGVRTSNVTFDAHASNQKCIEVLGVDEEGLVTGRTDPSVCSFPDPSCDGPEGEKCRVFVIYDPAHMIKLARNHLGTKPKERKERKPRRKKNQQGNPPKNQNLPSSGDKRASRVHSGGKPKQPTKKKSQETQKKQENFPEDQNGPHSGGKRASKKGGDKEGDDGHKFYWEGEGMVEWKFIKALHDRQVEAGLRFGNKLTKKCMNFHENVMKVSLACQTLSESVADAIAKMNETKDEKFQGSETTVKCLRLLDKMFDVLNSKRRDEWKRQKRAMSRDNKAEWQETFRQCRDMLLHLQEVDGNGNPTGKYIYQGRKKSFVIGFLMCMASVENMFTIFCEPKDAPMFYLCTYRLSQDHLEFLFGAIRAGGGGNTQPTALLFKYLLRKAVLLRVRDINSGNCLPQDSLPSLLAMKEDEKEAEMMDESCEAQVMALWDSSQHDYLPNLQALPQFDAQVVAYIAGWIVYKLRKRTLCEDCYSMLHLPKEGNWQKEVDDDILDLVRMKDKFGRLVYPSPFVTAICLTAERVVRHITGGNPVNVTLAALMKKTLQTIEFSELLADIEPKEHVGHVVDEDRLRDVSKLVLMKFLMLRMYGINKSFSEKKKGVSVKNKLVKMAIFMDARRMIITKPEGSLFKRQKSNPRVSRILEAEEKTGHVI